MRKAWIWSLPVVLGLLGPSAAVSAPVDGTAPFLCAVIQAMECEPDGTCEKRSAEDINLPSFLKIDPKAKTISAPEPGGRSTPVHDMTSVGGKLVMHGGQEGRGWSAVVSSDTGKLSASIVDAAATFVIFGACTTP
jgi:hypothetical protein